MAFKPRTASEVSAETPEKLFPLLPRTGGNSDALWSQQTDLLREYAASRQSARDLAVELPTGTGKTLTGLMIADWRRRQNKARAIFAAPTVQLVRQVLAAAQREGIPAVDLSGGIATWKPADKTSYERGRAIGVTTYSSIFNVSPKLIAAEVIVFDDSHAGEQYVASAYTVTISRSKHGSIYSDFIESVKTGFSTERYAQLITNNPGAGTRKLVDPLVLALRDDWLAPVGMALSKFGDQPKEDREARNQTFKVTAIRDHLPACVAFVAWDRIELRPMIPPTFENTLFSSAKQRVYLSATLGSSGELERAFGRPKIKRMSLPKEAPTPKSGRRFLVFPHLVPDVEPDELAREILALAGKAIVIAPSDRKVIDAETNIVPGDWTVFHKDEVEDSFDAFAAASKAGVVLANRYDGIDLPGDSCRAVALYGFPGATNLQESFLSTRARASSVMEERIRSRVIQGTGRCTRGPKDWALVVVADPETTTYLSRQEVQQSLDEDLQAEVIFGLEQSETSKEEVLDNVRAFLAQGTEWRRSAEPDITEIRSEVQRKLPAVNVGLAEAASLEVEALELIWNGDWHGGGVRANAAAGALGSYPDARGYRATQLFLSAVYTEKASRQLGGDLTLARTADALADQGVKAATPATWMNAYLPFPNRVTPTPSAPDLRMVELLNPLVGKLKSPKKLQDRLAKMIEGLQAIDHDSYEPALTELGTLLGATAFKPTGDGRTDSVWCWGNEVWMTLEAKSEHVSTGPIGLDDVRQVNHHLDFLEGDRGVHRPADSASIMISPRQTFKRDVRSIAKPWTFKATPDDIQALASAVQRLWLVLSTLANIDNEEDRRGPVLSAVRDAGLRPRDVLDRLTEEPIATY